MKKNLLKGLLVCGIFTQACGAMAATGVFDFGVIAHPFESQEVAILRESIQETDSENLAFVVANGIKARSESCSDAVYNARKELLDSAKNGMIVSPAASDWTDCKGKNGRSTAMGRLNRLRELFFNDEMSLGASKIPLVRQSASAKFRSYGENARWEVGKTMFATINLPENNNHYLADAGRNSEFEDRLIANREWLNRVFTYARLKKLNGIVLFSDGNPLARSSRSAGGARRDGFLEARQQITSLAAKFPGKVLVVYDRNDAGPTSPSAIEWRSNLATVVAGPSWTKVRVDPSSPMLFSVTHDTADATSAQAPSESAR
jgi:hypothetical protein